MRCELTVTDRLKRRQRWIEAALKQGTDFLQPSGPYHLVHTSRHAIVQEGPSEGQTNSPCLDPVFTKGPARDPIRQRPAGGERHAQGTQGALGVPRLQAPSRRWVQPLEIGTQSSQAAAFQPFPELALDLVRDAWERAHALEKGAEIETTSTDYHR